MSIKDILEMIIIQGVLEGKVDLQTLKRFVAAEELDNIKNKIAQEVAEIRKKLEQTTRGLNLEAIKNMVNALQHDLLRLGRLEMINEILKTISYENIDDYIGIIDTYNIELNGELSCSIIIERATEEELKQYVSNLMEKKQGSEENQKVN